MELFTWALENGRVFPSTSFSLHFEPFVPDIPPELSHLNHKEKEPGEIPM